MRKTRKCGEKCGYNGTCPKGQRCYIEDFGPCGWTCMKHVNARSLESGIYLKALSNTNLLLKNSQNNNQKKYFQL